jgi:hypothetical protein
MVSHDEDAPPGRKYLAVVSQDATVSQSTYYGYDYSVTTTTSTSNWTTTDIKTQILMNAIESDTIVRLGSISFFTHVMGGPGYSETHRDMAVEVEYGTE